MYCGQLLWIYKWVPEPRYSTVLDIRKYSDGDDISWSGEVLSPGKYLYPHLYSMHHMQLANCSP
jgi:hypothetical protein